MKLTKLLSISALLIAGSTFSQITRIEYEVVKDKHDHAHPGYEIRMYGDDLERSRLLQNFNRDSANAILEAEGIPVEERPANIYHMEQEFIRVRFPEFFEKKKESSKKPNNPYVPMKSGACENIGFEDLVFAPYWDGGISLTSTPGPFTNTTIVSNGVNASHGDQNSRHTLLTTPPQNNNQLNGPIIGYDPLAINTTTGLAEIPFLAPGGNNVSVRLGNSYTQRQRERLKYVIDVTPTNRSFYYYFAVILQNPGNHSINTQPYLKVSILDSTGAIAGDSCGVYNVVSSQASGDTSYIPGPVISGPGISPPAAIYYRKWRRVDVDLTDYIGQQITIQFETGDCDQGGHFGYAYIDAGCQQDIDLEVNFCAGDSIAHLVAPPGFLNYQWYGPNSDSLLMSGQTNDTLTLLYPNLSDTFYVRYQTPSGCNILQSVVLVNSVIAVDDIYTIGTCFGANQGSVTFDVTGSSSGYIFDYQPNNVQTSDFMLDSLFAGNYTVHISSSNPNCGFVDTSFTISVAPTFPSNVQATYCDGIGTIVGPVSNTYQWYDNSQNPIPAPVGTQQTIYDTTAYSGEKYYLVYEQESGCFDSLIYTFYDRRVASSFTLTRPQGCRSIQIVFNDDTPASDTMTFSINGPNNYVVTWFDTAFVNFQTNGLDTGLYYVQIIDEGCSYDTTFTVVDVIADSVKYAIFCPNDPYFMSSIANGQHQWTDPLGNIISTTNSVLVNPVIEGAYIDSCEVIPGCYNLTTFNMDSITIFTDYQVVDNICNGGEEGAIYMQVVAGPPGSVSYVGNGPNGESISFNDSLTGIFSGTWVVATSIQNCAHFDTIEVNEPAIAGDTLTIYTEVCDELEQVALFAPQGFTKYQWFYKNVAIPNQDADVLYISYPQNLNDYSVTFSAPPLGCKKKTIKFNTAPYQYDFSPTELANVFTPNGDGTNGKYHPFFNTNWDAVEIDSITRSFRMIIYNRWGNKIWETESYLEGWNGETQNGNPVDDGVYYAEIRYAQKCESNDYMYKAVQMIHVVRD